MLNQANEFIFTSTVITDLSEFRAFKVFILNKFDSVHKLVSIKLCLYIVRTFESIAMNSVQVVVFIGIVLSISMVECQPKPRIDDKCLVPPPNDVDPMQCCKVPEFLDPKLIDTCANKAYGPESTPTTQNEPPFAPHLRVSIDQLRLIYFKIVSNFQRRLKAWS